MDKFFTHYWAGSTVQSTGSAELFDRLGSGQFRARGVTPGDKIYGVNIRGGKVYLLGRLVVGGVMNTEEARARVGDIWEAPDQVLAASGTASACFARELPTEVVADLRFLRGRKEVGLKFRDGLVDNQTLRGVRRLSRESADLLERQL